MVDANSGNVEGRLVSPSPVPLSTVSRRTFLRSSALGLGALALAGSRATSTPSSATDRSTPRHGGTLRAALSGGTSSDTLDAQAGVNFVDIARCWQLYDGLLTYTDDAGLELALAEEITPNHDATLWTIRVKPGITCHDGKPFGAEDVIYSLRRIMNPKSPLPGAASVGPIDYNGMRKVDARTCTISCHSPFSTFAQLLPTHYFTMVPVDYNPKKPIGTGPFRFKSFTPGVQSIFPRNDNYWQDPLPYADEVITSDYSDETSQINALLSGEADLIDLLSAVAISTVKSGGGDIVISHGGGITPFTMRVDQPPFNDVRVRQALRLLVDRPEMMDLIFEGHGILGNDITSIWDPVYDH